MLFNSFAFAVFLPLVFALYWGVRRIGLQAQNVVLLLASYVFYGMWDYRFLSLLFISSLVDYRVGLRLATTTAPRTRRLLLSFSLGTNLGLLAFFKYFGFFVESFASLMRAAGLHADPRTLAIVLPVGISFYTFQTLSYTIDIYRGSIRPTRDPIAFFAFVSFFPQLVAGPIERAGNLLPQFLAPRQFDLRKARDGLRQMLWGFFKKVVVADNLSEHVHLIFESGRDSGSLMLHAGVLLFAFQIYCDFSGYSDIAIGCGRLFGVNLMRNFSYPYFSRDIAEFWRRWHISLSTWFRDYLYIPLGGNRVDTKRRVINVMITFGLSGLWHGASWTFVVWGLLNGAYFVPLLLRGNHKEHMGIVAEGRLLPSIRDLGGMAATFYLTLLAWVFFRADSLPAALQYLGGMLGMGGATGSVIAKRALLPDLAFIIVLVLAEWLQRARPHALSVEDLPLFARWGLYVAVCVAILLFGNFGEVQFIYFQF